MTARTKWKLIVVAATVLTVSLSFSGVTAEDCHSGSSAEEPSMKIFENWILDHGKSYKDGDEKCIRFEIFKQNMKIVNNHNNQKESTYKLGLNGFADLSNLEFRNNYLGLNTRHASCEAIKPSSHFRYANITMEELPLKVDWRLKGAVYPVKDQGRCGSCWAFATVAAVESIHQIKRGELISLSEQELVSCDKSNQNAGCQGGYMDYALDFIFRNGGIDSSQDYGPYISFNGSTDGECSEKVENVVVSIDGYDIVPKNSEKDLQKAVAHQPVIVAIDATDPQFMFYSSGIISGSCETDLDHAVLVVGYGTTSHGQDYWIIKNSWGTGWGKQGYGLIGRNIKDPRGLCGIAMNPCFPFVKD